MCIIVLCMTLKNYEQHFLKSLEIESIFRSMPFTKTLTSMDIFVDLCWSLIGMEIDPIVNSDHISVDGGESGESHLL